MRTSLSNCAVCQQHAESSFKVPGMDCQEEIALIERRFKGLPGLEDVSADLVGQRLHVKYDAAVITPATIAAALADAGLQAWQEHEEPMRSTPAASWRGLLLVISGGALAGGLTLAVYDWTPLASTLLYVLSLTAAAPLTIRRAVYAIRVRHLDINVLMLIAAAGAIALGEWSEAAAVVFLFAIAQALEAQTLDRARAAVRQLMDLTPTEALVREGGRELEVPVDRVPLGAVVVVKPGTRIPLDGEIMTGSSNVNQAPVTGESMPVDKGPGDEVFAGTINGRGALEIRVTCHQRDTTLARIIHLVEIAQAQRAPLQTFVERFARVYTPAVITLAAILALVPPVAFGGPWSAWIYRALVLLVVACPCALVISTPISIVAALAGAARRGVLIKGGVHLERAAQVRCVAFDKTGTLTCGTPQVVNVATLNGLPPAAIVALAASVEHRSEHPIAKAIVQHAQMTGVPVTPARDVVSLGGRGAEGWVEGSRVLLGNHRVFEERQLCSEPVHDYLERSVETGHTSVLVARDALPVGAIAVADQPRDTSHGSILELRRLGIESIAMLTGDSEATARRVGALLGVDDVRAELMPEDKVAAVSDLRRRYGPVAMVGDGVNDAPALASADVGIVMGAAGSDAALETADIALMADDLQKVPYALRLSKATVLNIQINLAISLAMKAAFVVAATWGLATLWMAIVADTGASLIVVANALRLLRTD